MKRVLVTGGAGFIAHHLIYLILKTTNWDIISLDRLDYSGNLNRLHDIISSLPEKDRSRVKILFHDLKAEINPILKKDIGNIDIILHLAAGSHVTRSIQNPMEFVMDNVVGTANILEFARYIFKANPNFERYVYFSTDEVFGPSEEDTKFKEWDRYNSKNPYSATKAAGEELTIAYSNTYSIPSLISHCCNVYGQRQHHEKFIPNSIKKILSNENIIVDTDENNNPGSRYYMHNEDLAESIIFLVTNHVSVRNESIKMFGKQPAKINITGESLITNLEVVEMIGEVLEMEFDYRLLNKDSARPGHDVKYGLDNHLIKSVGGHFDREFSKGLENVVSWYTSNKGWIQ